MELLYIDIGYTEKGSEKEVNKKCFAYLSFKTKTECAPNVMEFV